MSESNKIEHLNTNTDKMASNYLETTSNEKITLMEKAKAKIQREIKILVKISTFKKDNSQRSALNKWFQDSVKNYFLEVFAAPLIMNELGFTSINQVKEYIHQRVIQSEAKFMSLILNYYLEIKRFSKLSTFRSNLEELVLSSLLESQRKNDDRYSSYNRQKNIRKQFVGLLLLVFCDCQDNNIPTTSFYDLWNTAYPNDLQYKKKLSRYDLLRGERTVTKMEKNSSQESQGKISIKAESSEVEADKKEQIVSSNISKVHDCKRDTNQDLHVANEGDSQKVKKRKRRARRTIFNEQILPLGDPNTQEYLGDINQKSILNGNYLQREVKQEIQEEKDNLFQETSYLDQIRVSTSCPTNQTTSSAFSFKTKEINTNPQQESLSEKKISKKQSKNNKKLQIKDAAHWGFIQREEISTRTPGSSQKYSSAPLIQNFNQTVFENNLELCKQNNPNNHSQSLLHPLCPSDFKIQSSHSNQFLTAQSNQYDVQNSHIKDSIVLLPNPSNKNKNNESQFHSVRQQFSPSSTALSGCSTQDNITPNTTNFELKYFTPNSNILNSQQSSLSSSSSARASLPLEFANQVSNQFSISCPSKGNSIQSQFIISSSPSIQIQQKAMYPISQPEQQKYILDSPIMFQQFQYDNLKSSLRQSYPQNLHLISNGEQFQDKNFVMNSLPTVSLRDTKTIQSSIGSCTNLYHFNNNIINTPQQQVPLQFGQLIFLPFGNQSIQQNPQYLMSNGYFFQQLPITNDNTSLPLISQTVQQQQQQSLLSQCNYMQIH